jgi:hypothetical protein
MKRVRSLLVLTLGLLALSGCTDGKKTPVFTPAEIVVTLNGQPLPKALVTLTPTDSGYGPESVSSGVTDDKGRVKLMAGTNTGACVGINQVTIDEGPLPEETRSEDPAAQVKASNYLQSLKNRPIPQRYATVATSDVKLEIKEGQTEYKLELTR